MFESMTYDAILVEDEPNIRALLLQLIGQVAPNLRVVASCGSVAEGVAAIPQHRPQLLFLDVQIGGGTSFDLLNALPPGSYQEVIFISAHDRYALEAFRRAAVGYVLKPVDAESLKAAIDQAIRRLAVGVSVDSLQKVLAHLQALPAPRTGERLAIPTAQGFLFRPVADLLHCESDRNYTWLHFRDGERILSSYNLGEFRRILPTDAFAPVHKSHLVAVQAIAHYTAREGVVTLTSGARVPVSRSARTNFLKRFLVPHRDVPPDAV